MLQDLLSITGSIDTNRGDVEGYNGFKNALLSAKEHNLEHEVLTGDQVNARFPGYNLPSNFMVRGLPVPILHSHTRLGSHRKALFGLGNAKGYLISVMTSTTAAACSAVQTCAPLRLWPDFLFRSQPAEQPVMSLQLLRLLLIEMFNTAASGWA